MGHLNIPDLSQCPKKIEDHHGSDQDQTAISVIKRAVYHNQKPY